MASTQIRHASPSKESKKLAGKVFDFSDRRALLETDKAPQELIDEAISIKEQALLALSMENSPLTGYLDTRIHYHIPTTQISTMAVVASGDGMMMLLFNPEFTCKLGKSGAKFVLYHEIGHVIMRHFNYSVELRTDPVFTHANEITINHWVLTRLDRKSMPSIDTGEVDTKGNPVMESTGVDPHKSYQQYSRDLKGQGLDPVTYDRFVSSDIACYAELKRMAKPPNERRQTVVCVHQVPGDDNTGSGEGLAADQETIDRNVGDSLQQAMTQAMKGVSAAKEELLDLAKITEGASDRASTIWGSLGVGALRGETVKTRKVEWWQRWLRRVLGSRLVEGGKLVYPRKRAGILHRLGFDSPLLHRGPERQKTIVVAIDASGSMPDEVIKKIATLVGSIRNTKAHWLWFDATVGPFKPGEPICGGGGTSFQPIADYVEGNLALDGEKFNQRVDAVVVVTDGYANPIRPADPAKWIWLVTQGGSMWMDEATSVNPKMSCHEIDLLHSA